MWLPWDAALLLAFACATVGFVARRNDGSRATIVAAVGTEAALVSMLYALWRLVGAISVVHVEGAHSRARWLWDVERALFLPNEVTVQSWLLPFDLWVQAANVYYGGAHVPGMGVFLVYMFFQHRDRYGRWRNVLASLTLVSVLIQLLPVAPPRFLDELGIVDTGIEYGQSVYAAFGSTVAGQLQAMPSIHVAWAMLIGAALWPIGGWARRVGVAHAVLTNVVVVVTGNHFWLDGVVATVLLVLCHRIVWSVEATLSGRPDDAAPGPTAEVVEASVG